MSISTAIQELLDAYAHAYQAGDATGCAALFTQDATLISPYAAPAKGRAEIAALHAEWTRDGGGAAKQMTLMEYGQSDDLAWCLATFSEGAAASAGFSSNVVQRQPDGRWLIHLCSLNADAT